jgi:hypothetical protein
VWLVLSMHETFLKFSFLLHCASIKKRRFSEARLQVLDVLKEHDCKGTFFVIGSYMDKWPQLVERMHREGERLSCFMLL